MPSEPGPHDHLPLSETKRHILLTLLEGVGHGYGIRHRTEERTEGRVVLAAGSLYHALPRLVEDGLVVEVEEPPEELEERATSRWRFYEITPLGRQVVQAEAERLGREAAWAAAALGGGGRP
jgi:DNA-binding PadR family transcriptional regulator